MSLVTTGHGGEARSPSYKARRASPDFELGVRHEEFAKLMAHGSDNARVKRLGLPQNEPLTVEQAAQVVGLRIKNAREITRTPAFQKLMLSLVAAVRTGELARSVATMIEVRDAKGEGTAADRKVRLDASKALVGEADKSLTVNVAVQNNLGIQVKAGFVIKPYAPIERDRVAAERQAELDRTPVFRVSGDEQRQPSAVENFLAKY